MNSRNTTKGKWPLNAAMILSLAALMFVACDINNNDQPYYPSDHQAPPVPTGVTSTTMDQAVLVSWNPVVLDPNYDDLAGYKVYWGRSSGHYDNTPVPTVAPSATAVPDSPSPRRKALERTAARCVSGRPAS